MSERTIDNEAYERAKANLTPEQIERIKAKCQWEHVSWKGVFLDWPELFTTVEPDGGAADQP